MVYPLLHREYAASLGPALKTFVKYNFLYYYYFGKDQSLNFVRHEVRSEVKKEVRAE